MYNYTFDTRLSFTQSALCGAVSGIAARTLTAPFDVAKVTAQVGLQNPVGRNSVLYMIRLWKMEGWKATFKGNGTACAKIFPYSIIQFLTFQQLKLLHSDDHGKVTGDEAAFSGVIAGWTATAITYPLDTVKTRLILQPYDKEMSAYKGVTHALKTIKNQEGYRGLFRGLTITLASTVPYGAAMFTTYELLNSKLDRPGHLLSPLESLYRGMIASSVALALIYPLDTIRKKVQAWSNYLPQKGGVDLAFHNARTCCIAIYRNQGVKGFYRGIVPALLRISPYNGVMFLSYQTAVNACCHFNDTVYHAPEPHYSDEDAVEVLLRDEEQRKQQEMFDQLPLEEKRARIELFGKILMQALHEVEDDDKYTAEKRKREEKSGGTGEQ